MFRSSSRCLRGKLLFTPGPLLTSDTVKQAMLTDYGSRDSFFMDTIKVIRQSVLEIGNVAYNDEWTCIPMQGSGTMGVEAAISTSAPNNNSNNNSNSNSAIKPKAIVHSNGAYGVRHSNICRRLGIETNVFESPEGQIVDLEKFSDFVKNTSDLTTFVAVHSETSTGVMNPIEDMSKIVRAIHPRATIIVDAMSSFGGTPIDTNSVCDVLVTSANKCIQGVPGFSLCLARKPKLDEWRGRSRSFTLDLSMQFDALEKSGQFPFTPPTHVLVAFRQALAELEAEGGVEARAARYKRNADKVIDGMLDLGFELFIKDRNAPHLGNFIVAFDYPDQSATGWEFNWFYDALKNDNCVIYPGKASKADTFRIGCIGDLHEPDFDLLLNSVRGALAQKNICLTKKK